MDPRQPETDAQLLAAYRIDCASQIAASLREIARSGIPLSLWCEPWDAEPLGARLVGLDDRELRIDFPDVDAAERLVRAGRAIAVAVSTRLKLQFDVETLRLQADSTGTRLNAQLPDSLVRLQRRGAYRVRSDDRFPPQLTIVRGPAVPKTMLVQVTDISVTGIAFVRPDSLPLPPIGTLLAGAHLQLPRAAPIACGLIVRYHGGLPGAQPPLRLGCQLVGLVSEAERALQIYV
ncbi:MAG TPA: flagellar regulator YcgR PilZN domain-containing protein, partial [Burkholderiaceae bacterium]|nr:flagellar regulator YcgR PilZN domain-containing protein [Burkholderiaceae bacterium]